jgi:acetylornithine deacetylase
MDDPCVVDQHVQSRGGHPGMTDGLSAAAPIVQAVVAAAGPGTTLVPMSYWADSAFLAAAGIPTVLYGPEGDGAHAGTEWVSRSGTSTASTVLTQLAKDYCS